MEKATIYYQIYKPFRKNSIHRIKSKNHSTQDIINIMWDNEYIKSYWVYNNSTGEIYIQAANKIIEKILKRHIKKVMQNKVVG